MNIEGRPNSGAISTAKRASPTGRLDAVLDRIALDPAGSLVVLTVLGVVNLTLIVFVWMILLGPSAPAPETVSALPPLVASLPPLPEVESNSDGQVPVRLGESRKPEPVPTNGGVPRDARVEPASPAASTPVQVQEKTPLAQAVESPRRHGDESDRAAPPPHPREATRREVPVHGVQAMTITTGHRYSATVTLSFAEAFADNGRIASILTSAGFAHVTVTGSGNTRTASGTWTGATMTRAVDPHLSDVRDLSG